MIKTNMTNETLRSGASYKSDYYDHNGSAPLFATAHLIMPNNVRGNSAFIPKLRICLRPPTKAQCRTQIVGLSENKRSLPMATLEIDTSDSGVHTSQRAYRCSGQSSSSSTVMSPSTASASSSAGGTDSGTGDQRVAAKRRLFVEEKRPAKNPRRAKSHHVIQRKELLDLESPDSSLTQINPRFLVNDKTFSLLPISYRRQLLGLLPICDRTHEEQQLSTALSNEFLTKALQDFPERLARGEFLQMSPRLGTRTGLRRLAVVNGHQTNETKDIEENHKEIVCLDSSSKLTHATPPLPARSKTGKFVSNKKRNDSRTRRLAHSNKVKVTRKRKSPPLAPVTTRPTRHARHRPHRPWSPTEVPPAEVLTPTKVEALSPYGSVGSSASGAESELSGFSRPSPPTQMMGNTGSLQLCKPQAPPALPGRNQRTPMSSAATQPTLGTQVSFSEDPPITMPPPRQTKTLAAMREKMRAKRGLVAVNKPLLGNRGPPGRRISITQCPLDVPPQLKTSDLEADQSTQSTSLDLVTCSSPRATWTQRENIFVRFSSAIGVVSESEEAVENSSAYVPGCDSSESFGEVLDLCMDKVGADTREEVCANTTEEVSVNTRSAVCASTREEICTNTRKEICADNREGVCANTTEEVSANTSEVICANTRDDVCADNREEVCANTRDEVCANTTEEVSAKTTEEVANTRNEVCANTTDEVSAKTTEEVANTRNEVCANTTEEVSAKTTEEVANSRNEMCAHTSEEVSAKTTEEVANTREEVCANTREEICAKTTEEVANSRNEMCTHTTDEVSAKTTVKVANTRDEVCANTRDEVCANTTEEVSAKTTDEVSAKTTEEVANTRNKVCANTTEEVSAKTTEEVANTRNEVCANTMDEVCANTMDEVCANTTDEVSAKTTEEVANTPSQTAVSECVTEQNIDATD